LWSKHWAMEELAREPEGLRRATLAEVQAAAKRYAVPTQASFVLIGDRTKIEQKLRSLKVADVTTVDVEARPLAHTKP